MVATVQVRGERQLRATLRKAGDDLADLRAAHADAARIAAGGATSRVPRRTGTLAGTIRPSGTKTAGIIRAGYGSVPYANPIHWGWPGRFAGQPFASEGARATQPAWTLAYLQAVNKILGRVKGA